MCWGSLRYRCVRDIMYTIFLSTCLWSRVHWCVPVSWCPFVCPGCPFHGRKESVWCVVCLACDVCVALSLSVTCGRVVWTCERVILWHTIMEEDR